MTYYGRWTYKYEEAARQGAAAAFIVHDTAPASYGWNVVQIVLDRRRSTIWTIRDNHMDQSQVIGWLTNDAATRLLASAGQDLDALSARRAAAGLPRRAAGRSRASVSLDQRDPAPGLAQRDRHPAGHDPPGRICLYTAHWDHLGRCDADASGDDICNGAIDNATGTAGLVALAEAHARAGPAERTLIFLAVTAEELGLLGSAYYAEQSGLPARADRRRHQHGRLDARRRRPRRGRRSAPASPSSTPICAAPPPADGLALTARAVAGGRLLLPLRPFQPRQAGRADALCRSRRGSGQRRPRRRPARRRRTIAPTAITSPRTNMIPNWDWTGALQELRIFYRDRPRAGGERRLAELEPGRRIPRHPRPLARRAVAHDGRPPAARMGAARMRSGSAFRAMPSSGRRISSRRARRWRPSPRGPCRRQGRGGAAGRRRRRVGRGGARGWRRSRPSIEQTFGDIWLRDTGPIILEADGTRRARELPLQRLGRQI